MECGIQVWFTLPHYFSSDITIICASHRIALLLDYKYIIFSNNDVLVPPGAVDEVRTNLRHEALVVPLTTRTGAGHNPTQVI